MITTLAIENYRSVLKLRASLSPLNVITGSNGSGKSNLFRALQLLADTARGGVINSLAGEGGLNSTLWAGPEQMSRPMQTGEVAIQGGPRRKTVQLQLGFATDDFGYAISLGLPTPSQSAFALDPEIKQECIWSGPSYRPATALVKRNGPVISVRNGRSWKIVSEHTNTFDSMFSQVADTETTPEIFHMRETIRSWRFYDNFRTDSDAPARKTQLGTRTPVLHHDGRDLAAALQTIREIGDGNALDEAINDAFPGARLEIACHEDNRFSVLFHQQGLLRPLTCAELSDGTLRYILLVAALLTPRPPLLMVLNEPENSLHPDLLPALARLIIKASEKSQVWVVSHANRLVATLNKSTSCHAIELTKQFGQTEIIGQGILDTPSWYWPSFS